jgi:hypothetical protein
VGAAGLGEEKPEEELWGNGLFFAAKICCVLNLIFAASPVHYIYYLFLSYLFKKIKKSFSYLLVLGDIW